MPDATTWLRRPTTFPAHEVAVGDQTVQGRVTAVVPAASPKGRVHLTLQDGMGRTLTDSPLYNGTVLLVGMAAR